MNTSPTTPDKTQVIERLKALKFKSIHHRTHTNSLESYYSLTDEATQAIKSLIKEIAEDIIGESEQPPIGEMGKFDAQTRTFELDTDTEAVKYHIQRVANQNNLRQSQREKLKGLLK